MKIWKKKKENLLILISTVIGCVKISALASLVDIPIGISITSVVELKIYGIMGGIKTCNSAKKRERESEKRMIK